MNIRIIVYGVMFITLGYSSLTYSEPTIPRFYVDYAIVNHKLKNDTGKFDELMKLTEINRSSADFIASFWWSKALKECTEYIDDIVKKHIKQIDKNTSKDKEDEIMSKAKDLSNQCIYGVYYDHWDEINDMIEQTLNKELAAGNK